MIAVLADDFTGAAEIGGIALRHGYRVVLDTWVRGDYPDSDIVVIATDTRSMQVAEARECVRNTISGLLKLHPRLIYKKIDSVLRGNIVDEMTTQMEVLGSAKALVVPANPSLQRTISKGVYYYQGVPLAQSDFGIAGQSSVVVDLLENPNGVEVTMVERGGDLPENGILVANVEETSDLEYWAGKIDRGMVVAGASGFFSALLNKSVVKEKFVSEVMERLPEDRAIYVCGSAFPASRKTVENALKAGCSVAYMPEYIFSEKGEQLMLEWKEQIVRGINDSGSVIVAVGKIRSADVQQLSVRIREAFAEVIRLVLDETSVCELLIEGGATASELLRKLNYSQLIPVQELATGVIRSKVAGRNDLHITMKPGSYVWPSFLWPYPVEE